MNHGTDSNRQLYLLSGTQESITSAGKQRLMEWQFSVSLVEVAGEGLKISSFNTLGNENAATIDRGVCSDLGMFRY